MPRKSLRPLVDRLLDGRLRELLAERIDDGQSFEQIARWLDNEHDVDVTGETIRRWWTDWQTPAEEVAS